MTDIAKLGYEVDSSGLERGTRALDQTTAAAEKTSDSANRLKREFDDLQKSAGDSSSGVAAALNEQENRYRTIAQRGVQYADSMKNANLSERAMAEAAKESISALDAKTFVMARAGSEQSRMAERVEALRASERRAAEATAAAARASQLRELNLKKLVGQIDPTVAKLDKLAKLERDLERARDLGAISPEVFSQYQAKIDAVRDATLTAGRATDSMTNSLGKMNLQSIEVQQSWAALGRSLVTGQWGQAQASVTSLTARTGILGTVFSGTGVMILGAVGAVGAFTAMATKGYFEGRRMEGMVIGLGEASGLTTGQILDMRNEIGRATGDYEGATKAINDLLLSGKATGDVLGQMASIAVEMSRLTGQSISTTTSQIKSLADGGEEALIRLNDQYHFLTLSTYRNIEAIREQDGDMAALQVTVAELERVMAERGDKMEDTAGAVEKAWRGVLNVFNAVVEGAKNYGREDLDYRIAALQREIDRSRVTRDGLIRETARTEKLREQLAVLQEQKKQADAAAAAREREQKHLADVLAIEQEAKKQRKEAGEELDRRLAQMDLQVGKQRELNEVIALYNRLADDDPRHFDGSMERMLAAVEKKYDALAKKASASKERMTDEERAAQRLQQQYDSAEASLARQIALFGQVGHAAAMAYDTAHGALQGLSAEQKATLMEQAQWLDWLEEMDALQGVWDDVAADYKTAQEKMKGETDVLSEYTKQAARNMQSHFADFLFDPFDKGTKSMGKAFSDTLRRMIAEAASAKFFQLIGNWASAYTGAGAGFINAIGSAISSQGGGREYGGPVAGRGMYRVGERNKPELLSTPNGQFLIPGESGRVDPIRATPIMAPAAAPVQPGVMRVEINNNGGAPLRGEARMEQDPDGLRKLVVDVWTDDFMSGGQTSRAVKQRLDVKERL